VKRVHMTTDGACIGNPGPGGWACILRYFDRKKEFFGSEEKVQLIIQEIHESLSSLSVHVPLSLPTLPPANLTGSR
jgi:ribonuclease HI